MRVAICGENRKGCVVFRFLAVLLFTSEKNIEKR